MLLSLNSFNNGFYRNPAIVDKMADILENSIKVNKPSQCGQNGGYSRNSIKVNKPSNVDKKADILENSIKVNKPSNVDKMADILEIIFR